ncbi:MAG TPA: efflux RND transporter periplasmic adaptor subunit [Chitinophagaceae bacterium]|nr:efflux RND transporter periplasmic adaptor subunit [Chitinophagaceae bacterium]
MNNLKQIPGIGLIILSSLFLSCGSKKKNATATTTSTQQQQQSISADALIVSTQPLSADIEIPGTILAGETTEIHPEISGRVVQLNVREGTFVGKGALLAKLYDGDLQAQLRKLEVQLKIAEQTEDRQGQLLKIQGISQQEYDLSLLQVSNLKADINIVREAVRKTEIRAPFSGKLGLRNISPGAFVTPATIVTTISQVSQLKIQFNVPEKYGSQLKNGQPVNFMVDGSTKTFTANIIAAEVKMDENTRSLAIRALVKDSDPALIPGVFAKVRIILGKNEDAILIPTIVVQPLGRKKLVYLYKGGKSIPADITTGVRDSSKVQVLTGLNVGDTVITTGLLFLRPGADVKLKNIVQ